MISLEEAQPLLAALANSSTSVRLTALHFLARLKTTDEVRLEVGQHVISLLQTAPEGESFDGQTLNGMPYSEVIEIAAFVSTEAVQTRLHSLLEDVNEDVRIATERALAEAKNPESISQFFDEWLHADYGQYRKQDRLLSPTEFLIYLPTKPASRIVTVLVEEAVEYALTIHDAPPGNEILLAVARLQKRFEPDVNGLFKCYLKICESPSVITELTPQWSVSWGITWIVSRASPGRIHLELQPYLDSVGRVRDLAIQLLNDAAICKDIEETPQFGGALDIFLRSPRPLIDKWIKPHQESREITVTGHTLDGAAASHFEQGEIYRLRFRVGSAAAGNFAEGDITIKDVPKGGLRTHWVVTSTDVELVPQLSSGVILQKIGRTWVAKFDLLIPEVGSSKAKEVAVVAGQRPGTLLVTIYAISTDGSREIYREVSVDLAGALAVTTDETCKAPNHTHLTTAHEWTTPPEHIQVSLKNGVADVSTKRHRLEIYEFVELFTATDTDLKGPIDNVRDSLEKLREVQEDYLNDLNHADMAAHLAGEAWRPYAEKANGWQPLPEQTDAVHRDAFARVQNSAEWRTLARDGYALFNRCFPQGTQLRAVLEKLLPGSRIDFHWSKQSGPGWVSHVPWALMYTEPVDVTGQSLAVPEKFMGLRFRIGSRSWTVNNGSVALGGPDTAHSVHLLYWGRKPGDEVAVEAQWQAEEYGKWKQSKLLPDLAEPDLKQQIVLALDAPGPSPVAVVYFYCHCNVGDGAQPCLRFGNTAKRDDTIGRADLSQRSIPDGPLLFANACTTAQADPHITSELEQSFFERGVRAFIGTETKVPIKLASKFAWLYFQFFFRRVDPAPMPAGEALTQARLFLWTQYQNVGGLFYSMANQYDLYLASNEELSPLRR